MKTSVYFLLLATLAGSCTDNGSGVPGTVNLTIKASANCAGVADTIDVKLTDVLFGTVIAGGDAYTKAIAPMKYDITAFARNGVKQWSETRTILSNSTFECGCP